MKIKPERVAYWYFRLNGFLQISNFIIHNAARGGQRTDADVLAVRFPYRSEMMIDAMPMEDDQLFTKITDRPYIAIAELTKGQCKLNGPWTNRDKGNINRVLHAIGAFPPSEINRISDELYCKGFSNDSSCYISLIAIGDQENSELENKCRQITWSEILAFIHSRFIKYKEQKADHDQWDDDGKFLWNCACDERRWTVDEFTRHIIGLF